MIPALFQHADDNFNVAGNRSNCNGLADVVEQKSKYANDLRDMQNPRPLDPQVASAV
jgi:hypothetical protein